MPGNDGGVFLTPSARKLGTNEKQVVGQITITMWSDGEINIKGPVQQRDLFLHMLTQARRRVANLESEIASGRVFATRPIINGPTRLMP
jgi:hypothetical protein